jgi:hypothetical protein
MLDQDEDVIRAAEEAQEGDLAEAAQSAELEVMVTHSEQKAASTALSKVSIIVIYIRVIFTDHTLQLTRLAFKVNNSAGLIEEVEASCLAANIPPLLMVKPVDTRWNSKSLMISRAIYLKAAIEDICTKKSLVVQYKTHPLKIRREEWRILEELSPLLGVRDAFSASAFHNSFLFCRLSTTYWSKCRLQGYL